MGLNLSKRIAETLRTTPAFTSACSATFSHSLSLSQHSSPFLRPYQLLPASLHLHSLLTRSPTLPLLSRWPPPAPTQHTVDKALTNYSPSSSSSFDSTNGLSEAEFEKFAVELFRDLIVGEIVGRGIVRRGVLGVAAIAGVGMVVGGGVGVLGRAVGVYALGLSASVYLSLP